MSCPRCGRAYVEVRTYTDGSKLYVHRKGKADNPYGIQTFEDSCYVPVKKKGRRK